MYEISYEEKAIASALLNKGYKKAAQSFSKMARQEVKIIPSSLSVSHDNIEVLNLLKKDEELVLITTDIIGDLQGKSYLLFNQSECEAIFRACLQIQDSKIVQLIEAETFLKELDNILSATVITEFSNYLDVMIYGDVPILSKTNVMAIKDKIINDYATDGKESYFVTSNARFVFENDTELQPQFIWKLTEEFMEKIKEVSTKNKDLPL